tara:strand:- start:444 stop:737 length:294 start_codon:yes stop_codon:yes gene_type:complete
MTTNNNLITTQLEEIIEQYVEIVVDRMDTQSLVEYVTEDLTDRYNKMTSNELKEWIYEHEDEYLYDELVENVQIEDVNKQWQDFQEIKDNRQIGDRF